MNRKFTDTELEVILNAAEAEGLRHAKAYLEQHLGGEDQWPCGFAWVNIKPARGRLISFLKQKGIGHTDSYHGGYSIWNPSAWTGQNMDVKEAGARGFMNEMKKHGFEFTVRTRID